MSFLLQSPVLLTVALLCSAQAPGWAQQPVPKPATPVAKHPKATKPAPKPLNLNTASREELMKLPGINGKTADKIMAHRPYLSKAWLASDKVITLGLYQTLKDRVFVQVTNEDAHKSTTKPAAPAKP